MKLLISISTSLHGRSLGDCGNDRRWRSSGDSMDWHRNTSGRSNEHLSDWKTGTGYRNLDSPVYGREDRRKPECVGHSGDAPAARGRCPCATVAINAGQRILHPSRATGGVFPPSAVVPYKIQKSTLARLVS